MKINHCLLAATFFVATFFVQTAAWAQGSLTPPGAPAPTMKTADQIYAKLEPRIPVGANTTPGDANDLFIISQPGSYYLTTNIVGVSGKNGIEISANDVSLDLNGFALQGAGTGNVGVYIFNTLTNVVIRNGTISGWQSNSGGAGVEVELGGVYNIPIYPNSQNIVCEHLNVSGCGEGIFLLIDGCVIVRDCNCEGNSYNGIVIESGVVTGCKAINNQIGIVAYYGVAQISDCYVRNNSTSGIYVYTFAGDEGNTITGNTCINNNTDNVEPLQKS